MSIDRRDFTKLGALAMSTLSVEQLTLARQDADFRFSRRRGKGRAAVEIEREALVAI